MACSQYDINTSVNTWNCNPIKQIMKYNFGYNSWSCMQSEEYVRKCNISWSYDWITKKQATKSKSVWLLAAEITQWSQCRIHKWNENLDYSWVGVNISTVLWGLAGSWVPSGVSSPWQRLGWTHTLTWSHADWGGLIFSFDWDAASRSHFWKLLLLEFSFPWRPHQVRNYDCHQLSDVKDPVRSLLNYMKD